MKKWSIVCALGLVSVATTVARASLAATQSQPSSPRVEQVVLGANDGHPFSSFGYTVAISADGTTAMAGAYGAPSPQNTTGAVYVYARSAGTWSQRQKISAPNPGLTGSFGYSVAMSADGNTSLIGAYGEYFQNLPAGAFVYTRNPAGAWAALQELSTDDTQRGHFGMSVSISGDGGTGVVGTGLAAYVYARNGNVWTRQSKFTKEDTDPDGFGVAVAISSDGNTIVVGSHGAANVYVRRGGIWAKQWKLVGSEGRIYDFGNAISLSADGNKLILGASFANSPLREAGAAYVYVRRAEVWSLENKLVANDAAQLDHFGRSVALLADGNTAIVGADNAKASQGSIGAAYVFVRRAGVWEQKQKLASSGAAFSFGSSAVVSADGSTALIGANGTRYDETGENSPEVGNVSVFTRLN